MSTVGRVLGKVSLSTQIDIIEDINGLNLAWIKCCWFSKEGKIISAWRNKERLLYNIDLNTFLKL